MRVPMRNDGHGKGRVSGLVIALYILVVALVLATLPFGPDMKTFAAMLLSPSAVFGTYLYLKSRPGGKTPKSPAGPNTDRPRAVRDAEERQKAHDASVAILDMTRPTGPFLW